MQSEVEGESAQLERSKTSGSVGAIRRQGRREHGKFTINGLVDTGIVDKLGKSPCPQSKMLHG